MKVTFYSRDSFYSVQVDDLAEAYDIINAAPMNDYDDYELEGFQQFIEEPVICDSFDEI